MASHQWAVRVYYEDTDASGVVYHANYLRWFERARTEWLRAQGGHQQQLAETSHIAFTVSRLNIRYRRPARLDDLLTVESRILRRGRAGLDFAQRIERDGTLLCEAEVRVACVDGRHFKPHPLPEGFFQDTP